MNALSANNLLQVWEKGYSLHLIDRALLLLGTAESEYTYDKLADWTIGQRDGAILRLRMATFGAQFNAYLDCPVCKARLEFGFDGRAFQSLCRSELLNIEVNGYCFRLPTSKDLVQIVHEKDPIAAMRQLLTLCCVQADAEFEPNWTDNELQEIESRLAKADPQADIELDLACEVCGHKWQTAFDIASFFWEEIEARAKQLLQEIHQLASAYGWTEQQILALSDTRRSAYLEMVGL
jgi:hypothetical protein